jgi:hypothetical protein
MRWVLPQPYPGREPCRPDGNCRWRVREGMLSPQAFQWLKDLTGSSKRSIDPATSIRA